MTIPLTISSRFCRCEKIPLHVFAPPRLLFYKKDVSSESLVEKFSSPPNTLPAHSCVSCHGRGGPGHVSKREDINVQIELHTPWRAQDRGHRRRRVDAADLSARTGKRLHQRADRRYRDAGLQRSAERPL